MPHILNPDSPTGSLNQNPELDKTLTRSYAAIRSALSEHYPILSFPLEAKTGGQRVLALPLVMKAGMALRREGGNYKLVAVIELWTVLLERTAMYEFALEQESRLALYFYHLAAGTADELDDAVQAWQQPRK